MKIEHIAIWTNNLENLREFYCKYFEAKSSEKYTNQKSGFESYFLAFEEGCRLEIMRMPVTAERDIQAKSIVGLAHFAISVGSKEKVIKLTERFREDGYKVLSEPRTTGDGYYEGVISDPDGNRVEITE